MNWECILGDNEWCTVDDPCFTCADTQHRIEHPTDVDDCRACKYSTLRLSPVVGMESRGRKCAPLGPKGSNSWEKGIVRDERGMPFMNTTADGTLKEIGVKEWADNRATYDQLRNDRHKNPAFASAKE